MKKTMTYNDVYMIIALINDFSQLKLAAKAMTEKLLLRSHYMKAVREYEDFKQSVDSDESADDEAKAKAKAEKAGEEVEGFTPRSLSVEAFEQIVEAATAGGELISSGLAEPQKNDKGEAVALGMLPTELWLQTVAENLVEV